MGRRRAKVDADHPLPRGLNLHGKTYRARHTGQQWTYFGHDYSDAIKAFKAWQAAKALPGTVGELLDRCVGDVWPGRVRAGTMKQRTASDYMKDTDALKVGLGKCPLKALKPHHIAAFKNARAKTNPAHVRNELACLSSAISYGVEEGMLDQNPCYEVQRPPKSVRERLVTNAEYLAVHERAIPSVQLAMVLAVRTLGAPADVLAFGIRNVVTYADGRKTLRFRRGKTNVQVEVEIVGDLAAALAPFIAQASLHKAFVRTRAGTPYTVTGIGAMFRRYAEKAGVSDFSLRDLRAKGATDMYRAGVPIRHIQLLLGHKSVRTTEIYLKGLLTEIVRPNELPIIAAV